MLATLRSMFAGLDTGVVGTLTLSDKLAAHPVIRVRVHRLVLVFRGERLALPIVGVLYAVVGVAASSRRVVHHVVPRVVGVGVDHRPQEVVPPHVGRVVADARAVDVDARLLRQEVGLELAAADVDRAQPVAAAGVRGAADAERQVAGPVAPLRRPACRTARRGL